MSDWIEQMVANDVGLPVAESRRLTPEQRAQRYSIMRRLPRSTPIEYVEAILTTEQEILKRDQNYTRDFDMSPTGEEC